MNRFIEKLEMKRSSFIILIGIFLMFGNGYAQTSEYSDIKLNGCYGEAYLLRHDFSEGFVSFNYERTIGKKRRTHLRIGLYPDFETTMSFPLTMTRITRPLKAHHLEYGFGAIFRVEHYVDPLGINTRKWFYDIPAIMFPLMYRYQRNSGLFVRAGFNLFVSWPTILSPSISLGYKF